MPDTEMIVMVAAFAAATLAFVHVVRLIGTAIVHRTIRRIVDKDPTAAESLLDRLGAPSSERTGDDRLSVLLIAFGVAMLAASLIIGDPKWLHYAAAGASFPLIIGTALWLRLFFLVRAQKRGIEQ
jgi:hypothetical protein